MLKKIVSVMVFTGLLAGWWLSTFPRIGTFPPTPQIVQAATAYLDPNADGTAGADWGHTGSNFYSEVDEATREPLVPTITDYISHPNNKADTLFLRMGTQADVTAVTEITVWVYHNDGANGQFHVQLYNDNETTTYAAEQGITASPVPAWHSVTFSGLSLSQAQLDALTIRLRNSRRGGGPPITNYVYALYATVTYSGGVSISLSSDGAVDFGTAALGATLDTTGGGLNDVQTVTVDAGPANLDVRSTSFTDGANTWSLAASNGSDQVQWQFSPDGNSWTNFSAPDTLFSLATNVSQSSSANVYLRLIMPTDTSSYNSHDSIVTIVASSP